MATPHKDIVDQLASKNIVAIACGTTCAYLGDERNLREFLVADEVARQLRQAGTTVILYLIDDSYDPLTYGQLRIAVNKDPELIAKYQHWCGKPIAHLPDPWGCCESFAAHFEEELLSRLHYLDCHPTLVRTGKLYERGVYAPYVRTVLERWNEMEQFLHERFPTYQPDKLFWMLCPSCGYIDQTQIEQVHDQIVTCYCTRCDQRIKLPFEDVQGKLNWKLDCAVRWNILNINAEAFSNAYLEPQTGTFAIAHELSKAFFGGQQVIPIPYGIVKMENKYSIKLLDSLPRTTLRQMLVEHPTSELKLTRDVVVTIASRSFVAPQLTYLDFVKQLLQVWLLTPNTLSQEKRELVTHGIAFMHHFMKKDVQLQLPQREHIEHEQPHILAMLFDLIKETVCFRATTPGPWEQFESQAHTMIRALGEHKAPVLRCFRRIVGQQQGLPVRRLLFLLPIEYLQTLLYMLELQLAKHAPHDEVALVA